MESISLPLEVLTQQICKVCENYLSVGPVKVSAEGDIVCGRSDCDGLIKGKSTVSLYNTIACACLFKCSHHYSGCNNEVAFNTTGHENECRYDFIHECPLCFYGGYACGLVYHFRKIHPDYMPTEDILSTILSYGLKNHIDAMLKMSTLDLRAFLRNAPKIALSVCQNCKRGIVRRQNIYFCTRYHLACQRCCKKKCMQCNSFQPMTRKFALDNILLECEWKNCSEKRNFFEYLSHKQVCVNRRYKCPFSGCDYTSLLNDIRSHWHLSPMLDERNIVQVLPGECTYWLPPLYREIIYVCFDVDRNARVTLHNEGNVLPVRFKVYVVYCNEGAKLYSPVLLQKFHQMEYFIIEKLEGKVLQSIHLEALQ